MKVTLNLTKLLKDEKITQADFDRLAAIAKTESRSHAWSILMVIAVLSVVLGLVGLFPTAFSELFTGFVEGLRNILGNTLGRHVFYLLLTTAVLGGGVFLESGFLVCASCFVIMGWLGSSELYSHATYTIVVREPAITVIVLSALSLGALRVSQTVRFEYQNLALLFARTCLIFANIGFWVGSLWGSPLGGTEISWATFAVAWAVALVGVAIWGARAGRRFVVNTAAVFGSIHFYTQWFEALGAHPASLFIAGIIALGILYAFRWFNQNGTAISAEEGRRICPKCKAINFDDAYACRRCGESFE
jgi:iron complex transport system permease protein